ncbi:restriction endonuclease [Paeniglutamicibacter gangotriensis]|uniref:Restriction endonuclease n=1 Tax=Paeniglutamicibacter gangotriensis TaxID=254787 RepID=A0A5B0EGB4_9MICC|nr:restriction endonuclease [Paeniglutamicibacter gangotriensis]
METKRQSRVDEAIDVLRQLGFDKGRLNSRSGMILLGLLKLTVDKPWSEATNPMLGTSAILDWVNAEYYSKTYAPNTRETFRRQTLHQFVAAGLAQYNFDKPERTPNDKNNNYRVSPQALELLKKVGTVEFENELTDYLVSAPGLAQRYAAEREMTRLPVVMPDGTEIKLSAGGQNVLLKSMVEEFCSRFTPGGQVLYIGDADLKLGIFQQEALATLGIELDLHGKFPDLIVYMPDRNWLILLEAASSHGPVDAKRYDELSSIFASSTAGLVYVSCFPDRATMRKFLSDLAWETEAWAADEPSHMIHLNGSRFLGPYEDEELSAHR